MKKANERNVLDFNVKLHLIGRLWLGTGVTLIILIPVILGLYFKTAPDWSVFASAAVIGPMLINTLAGFAEPVIYAPMVGTNGEYLAFLTGNLSNLKIPCVVKAQEIVGTKIGTEENEIVSTIAIATSSLVTVLVIGVFVLCLAVIPGLQSTIESNKFLTPAFGCVVFALFGSLGGKYIVKNPKLALLPALAMIVVSIILGTLQTQLGSTNMFIGIAFCLLFAVYQFIRDRQKMKRKEEEKRLEAIAAGMSYDRVLEIEKQQADYSKAEAERETEEKKQAKKESKAAKKESKTGKK